MGQTITTALIAAVLSSTVLGILLNISLLRRAEEIKGAVSGKRSWQEASLTTLFGPVFLQFDRTKSAFERLKPNDNWIEANIFKTSNTYVRDLLLQHGHLVPSELLDDAAQLIAHYDVYLQQYDALRGEGDSQKLEAFVFAGPIGFPFPKDAEMRFKQYYDALRRDLYGVEPTLPALDTLAHVTRQPGTP